MYMYMYMYIHVHNILRVLMRDERRKKERSKQDQTNNKAKQHSTPKAVSYTLDRAFYHAATKAAQLAGPKSHIS